VVEDPQRSVASDTLSPLETLERLLDVPAANLELALTQAADIVAAAVSADKVDAFIYDPARSSLVAVGVSSQQLSALQRRLGLDVLPLANGGRAVQVFQTGQTHWSGHVETDPDEVRGAREAMKIRSSVAVPLEVGTSRRGVLMVTSLEPEFFSEESVRYVEAVARWVGIIVHRTELVEESNRAAAEAGRRTVAEELITVMAHDLRNFIAPINLRLTLIKRRAERDGRGQDVRDLDVATGGLNRLSGLVADILDTARIDQGIFRMSVEPVEACAVLEDIARVLATPEHGVEIRCADEVVVAADVQRFRQCLENLIANGVKHSPGGAPVKVRVSRRSQEGGAVARIEIIDQGPGIPAELLPRIFDRFVTGDRREGGLGLGLYLARQIALMHQGDLAVEAAPGQGTRFLLDWPCYQLT
jgi:two-component system OmpR family sensor kinase